MQNRFRVWNVELDSIENILNERLMTNPFIYILTVNILFEQKLFESSFCSSYTLCKFFLPKFQCNKYILSPEGSSIQSKHVTQVYLPQHICSLYLNQSDVYLYILYVCTIYIICTGDFLCMCHLCLRYQKSSFCMHSKRKNKPENSKFLLYLPVPFHIYLYICVCVRFVHVQVHLEGTIYFFQKLYIISYLCTYIFFYFHQDYLMMFCTKWRKSIEGDNIGWNAWLFGYLQYRLLFLQHVGWKLAKRAKHDLT